MLTLIQTIWNKIGGDYLSDGYITYIAFIIFYLPFLIRAIQKKKSIIYNVILILFFVYTHMLFTLLFYPIPITSTGIKNFQELQQGPYYNIIPFKDIIFFINWGLFHNELTSASKNLFGNIIAFMPFGFIFPLLCPRFIKFKRIIWISFLLPFCVELTQLCGSLALQTVWKFADVDDVILNMTGVILGFLILKLFLKLVTKYFGFDLLENIQSKCDLIRRLKSQLEKLRTDRG